MRDVQALLTGVTFLIGLFISILSTMFAISQKKKLWHALTIGYGVLVNVFYSILYGRPFDIPETIVFVVALIFLGWAVVVTEVIRKK